MRLCFAILKRACLGLILFFPQLGHPQVSMAFDPMGPGFYPMGTATYQRIGVPYLKGIVDDFFQLLSFLNKRAELLTPIKVAFAQFNQILRQAPQVKHLQPPLIQLEKSLFDYQIQSLTKPEWALEESQLITLSELETAVRNCLKHTCHSKSQHFFRLELAYDQFLMSFVPIPLEDIFALFYTRMIKIITHHILPSGDPSVLTSNLESFNFLINHFESQLLSATGKKNQEMKYKWNGILKSF